MKARSKERHTESIRCIFLLSALALVGSAHAISQQAAAPLPKPADSGPSLPATVAFVSVRRLAQWIWQRANLNELIPGLSTYMGYSSLTKAVQFLFYVPGRFSEDLCMLNPAKGRTHWRNRPELLQFLSAI